MASLVDDATKKFQAAVQARRDSRRQAEEVRDEHRLSGQQAYEARLAAEESRRQAERDGLHEAHLGRERDRFAAIQVLRDFRGAIAAERQRLIAAIHAAVERGDLAEAVEDQIRLAALGPVDGIAASRLSAHGVEVK